MKTVVDFAAASELTLYAENTRQVYDLTVQVIANLKTLMAVLASSEMSRASTAEKSKSILCFPLIFSVKPLIPTNHL